MRTPSAIVLAALLPGFTSCMSWGADLQAAYIQTELSGNLGAESTAGGGVSASADVQNDLGLDGSYGSLLLRGTLETPIGRFAASGFEYKNSGSGVLTVDFGDITAGATVDTNMEILNVKGSYTLDLLDLGFLRLSPGLGVDYFDIHTTVSSVSPVSVTETIDAQAPVPMLMLQVGSDIGPFGAVVEGGWMKIDIDDIDATFWDLDAMVRFGIFGGTEILAGYRYINIDGGGSSDGQAINVDLILDGWYLGGGFRF